MQQWLKPALLLAGLFAKQKSRPNTPGKLRTDSLLFAMVVIATAILVVGLTYFAVLTLGPIVEQLRMGYYTSRSRGRSVQRNVPWTGRTEESTRRKEKTEHIFEHFLICERIL